MVLCMTNRPVQLIPINISGNNTFLAEYGWWEHLREMLHYRVKIESSATDEGQGRG